jgi:uncharacterized protein YggT (Ycf19 family)
MDIWDIVLIIIILVMLTIILYVAAGLVSGDWDHSASTWLRFILVAGIAAILIPILQAGANAIGVGDLSLMISFIVIMFLVKWLIVPELTVGDEWMTTIFTAFLAIFVLYFVERIAATFFGFQPFAFVG